MITTSMPEIKLHDIVRLSGGSQMVVTDIKPRRPANPFVGVLVNGQGAEYKFGGRHNPVVIGHAEPGHPALEALGARRRSRDPDLAVGFTIRQLLEAVEAGDMPKAKILTAVIRTTNLYRKD
jgi:hypothetical protein